MAGVGKAMKLNERIKNIRIDRDKSQKEVAAYLGVDRKTYCRYENGTHVIRADTVISLAKYYNLSLDYVCGVTDGERPLNPASSKATIEERLVRAYKQNPEMQSAIKKMLDLE